MITDYFMITEKITRLQARITSNHDYRLRLPHLWCGGHLGHVIRTICTNAGLQYTYHKETSYEI